MTTTCTYSGTIKYVDDGEYCYEVTTCGKEER